jgi:hypothetical protein
MKDLAWFVVLSISLTLSQHSKGTKPNYGELNSAVRVDTNTAKFEKIIMGSPNTFLYVADCIHFSRTAEASL